MNAQRLKATWKTISMIKSHLKKKKNWKQNCIFLVFKCMELECHIKNKNACLSKIKPGRKYSKMCYGYEGSGRRISFGARPRASACKLWANPYRSTSLGVLIWTQESCLSSLSILVSTKWGDVSESSSVVLVIRHFPQPFATVLHFLNFPRWAFYPCHGKK